MGVKNEASSAICSIGEDTSDIQKIHQLKQNYKVFRPECSLATGGERIQ